MPEEWGLEAKEASVVDLLKCFWDSLSFVKENIARGTGGWGRTKEAFVEGFFHVFVVVTLQPYQWAASEGRDVHRSQQVQRRGALWRTPEGCTKIR